MARYAEDQAHTFGVRPKTQAWRYRDWVIDALNDDMPFDRFVKLQIAGDMLPDAPDDRFTQYRRARASSAWARSTTATATAGRGPTPTSWTTRWTHSPAGFLG